MSCFSLTPALAQNAGSSAGGATGGDPGQSQGHSHGPKDENVVDAEFTEKGKGK